MPSSAPSSAHFTAPSRGSLPALLGVQTQNAFNDYAVRIILIGLGQTVLPGELGENHKYFVGAALVAPFVLFAPMVGWISDHFSKANVIRFCVSLQLVLLGLIAWMVAMQWWVAATVGFFFLALESALFSPARYGILKELVGSRRLGAATGWMEMLATAGMLAGSILGAHFFDSLASREGWSAWDAAYYPLVWLTLAALVAFFWAFFVAHTPAQAQAEPFRFQIFFRHWAQLKALMVERNLRRASLGITYFWALGGVLLFTLIQVGAELNDGGRPGSVTDTALFSLPLLLGVAVGSLAAGVLCRRHIELGIVPVGGMGMAVSLIFCGLVPAGGYAYYGALFAVGFFGGLFIVPVTAYLQDEAQATRRSRVFAETNLLVNLGGVASLLVQYFLAQVLGMSPSLQFLVLSVPCVLISIYILGILPKDFLRLVVATILRLFYTVRVKGLENLPRKGGGLVVANHASYFDGFMLSLAVWPRPLRFIAYDTFHKIWWMGWILRFFGVIPISPRNAKQAIRTAAQAIEEGELVCLFPEGQMTRSGRLLEFKGGVLHITRRVKTVVVPMAIDGMWGSIFSRFRGRFFWKWPYRARAAVNVHIGAPLDGAAMDVEKVRGAVMQLAAEAFAHRAGHRRSLGEVALERLSRAPWKRVVVEYRRRWHALRRGTLRGLGLKLAQRWRAQFPERYVGVLLPPGIAATIAHLSLVWAGKVPVAIDGKSDASKLRQLREELDLRRVVTNQLYFRQLERFPWEGEVVFLRNELRALSRWRVWWTRVTAYLWPARWTAWGQSIELGSQRAVLWCEGRDFSSAEALAAVDQIVEGNFFYGHEKLASDFPHDTTLGMMWSLWFPLLGGHALFTGGDSLSLEQWRRKLPHQLHWFLIFAREKGVREELPKGVSVFSWAQGRGRPKRVEDIALFTGVSAAWALAPVCSNLPDSERDPLHEDWQAGSKADSLGRLLPGWWLRPAKNGEGHDIVGPRYCVAEGSGEKVDEMEEKRIWLPAYGDGEGFLRLSE